MNEMKDFRSFLRDYRQAYPQDFVEIDRSVKCALEINAVIVQFEKLQKFPLLKFNQPETLSGNLSPFPVVANTLGDRRKLAFAIGSTFRNVGLDWTRLASQPGADPVVVPRSEAPNKYAVYMGDEVDLGKFPAVHHFPMDPGAYVTSGMFTCYDPETWTDNCALHRGYFAGPREIRVFLSANTHNLFNLQAHERRGEPMKCAFWFGHHPSVLMGGHTKRGYPGSHYEAAANVLGQPLRLTPSETLGDDFLVPAEAEFVIEGIIQPGHWAPEGPFGEYPRYYGPQVLSPVMDVTAVTHRENALWDTISAGVNVAYSGVKQEQTVYQAVKRVVPQVTTVHCPESGRGCFHAYIQLKKTHDGQPKDAIMAALSAPGGRTKHAIVVDDDIDVFDERAVLWAVATRSQWDRDLLVMPGCSGPPLDPSNRAPALTAKGGIDATKPARARSFAMTLTVPPEVTEQVRLDKLLTREVLAAIPESLREVETPTASPVLGSAGRMNGRI